MRSLLQSFLNKSGATKMPEADDDSTTRRMPIASGDRIDQYHLEQLLGTGHTSIVYFATDDRRQGFAVKLVDPDRVQRPNFRERLEADLRTVARLSNPHILPVYQFGIEQHGKIFVAMAFAPSGTLKELLHHGALNIADAQPVLEAVAAALQGAHEAGVVHHDVKPSNVLFDGSGRPLLGDFGMPRTSYGVLGTPGYMPPEGVLGLTPDRRADVHALGALAFEMLTGTRPYLKPTPTETILATMQEPVPSASQLNPQVPPEVDQVLARAMAKMPEERYATAAEFMDDLAQVASGAEPRLAWGLIPHITEAMRPGPSRREQFEQSAAKLQEILDLALTASVMVDQNSYIVGWNALAEQTFGWTREEIVGRSLVTTLIPPRYREPHERGLSKYLETGEGPVLGQKLELSALHRDGRELPVELSITEAVRSEQSARILAFLRDTSREKLAKRMAAVQSAVLQAIEDAGSLQAAASRVLEAIGRHLDWNAGLLWLVDGERRALRLERGWHADGTDAGRLEEAAAAAEFGKDEGVPGRAWARGEPVWFEDLLAGEDTPRVVAALRSGLRTVAALPVLHAGEVRGVVELFSATARPPDDLLLDGLYELGRRLGRVRLTPD